MERVSYWPEAGFHTAKETVNLSTFFGPSSCIALVYRSICSRTIGDWLLIRLNRRKNLDGKGRKVYILFKAKGHPFHPPIQSHSRPSCRHQNPSNFSSSPIVLESIWYRTRSKRLISKSNTTRCANFFWTGKLLYVEKCARPQLDVCFKKTFFRALQFQLLAFRVFQASQKCISKRFPGRYVLRSAQETTLSPFCAQF